MAKLIVSVPKSPNALVYDMPTIQPFQYQPSVEAKKKEGACPVMQIVGGTAEQRTTALASIMRQLKGSDGRVKTVTSVFVTWLLSGAVTASPSIRDITRKSVQKIVFLRYFGSSSGIPDLLGCYTKDIPIETVFRNRVDGYRLDGVQAIQTPNVFSQLIESVLGSGAQRWPDILASPSHSVHLRRHPALITMLLQFIVGCTEAEADAYAKFIQLRFLEISSMCSSGACELANPLVQHGAMMKTMHMLRCEPSPEALEKAVDFRNAIGIVEMPLGDEEYVFHTASSVGVAGLVSGQVGDFHVKIMHAPSGKLGKRKADSTVLDATSRPFTVEGDVIVENGHRISFLTLLQWSARTPLLTVVADVGLAFDSEEGGALQFLLRCAFSDEFPRVSFEGHTTIDTANTDTITKVTVKTFLVGKCVSELDKLIQLVTPGNTQCQKALHFHPVVASKTAFESMRVLLRRCQ